MTLGASYDDCVFHRRSPRLAFTLIELIVSLVTITLLLSLILPAIQHSRESARRTTCASSLRQLGIAVAEYASTHNVLPPGSSGGWSVFASLLPHIEQSALYSSVIFSRNAEYDPTIPLVLKTTRLSLLICPSDSGIDARIPFAPTNYAANFGCGVQKYDFNGVFRHWGALPGYGYGPLNFAAIRDGSSNTAAFSEIVVATGESRRFRTVWELPTALITPNQYAAFASACSELSTVINGDNDVRGRYWLSGEIVRTGYTHILPPNSPNCLNGNYVQHGQYSSGSEHFGGASIMLLDGRVTFVSNSIDIDVWRAYGSRDGRETHVP